MKAAQNNPNLSIIPIPSNLSYQAGTGEEK
jgi:hypothetical protein